MLWTEIAATLVVGIVLLAVAVTKRPVKIDELGSVSEHWVAQHRVDSSWP